MTSYVEAGNEKLNIDRVFQWSEVPEAHRYMESNQASGKCVVLLDEEEASVSL